MMILYVVLGAATALGAVSLWRLKQRKSPDVSLPKAIPSPESLGEKLRKTREHLFGKAQGILGLKSLSQAKDSDWQALEEALLAGDVGTKTTTYLLQEVRQKSQDSQSPRTIIENEMIRVLTIPQKKLDELMANHKPLVIAVVGINGAGKTTTIGKLAKHFRGLGKTVLLGAADTFRAGAISQLEVWADRVGVDFVKGREGADPGAVAFDSVTAGKARHTDVVILDTAGRLHTKTNLMDELKKIQKVIKKVIPDAPHETWLVLDGTLGQNSLVQAREFQQTLGLTGAIITKLDGTAKGGAVLPVAQELSLPIRFIGVGEKEDDLVPFKPEQFVQGLLQ